MLQKYLQSAYAARGMLKKCSNNAQKIPQSTDALRPLSKNREGGLRPPHRKSAGAFGARTLSVTLCFCLEDEERRLIEVFVEHGLNIF